MEPMKLAKMKILKSFKWAKGPLIDFDRLNMVEYSLEDVYSFLNDSIAKDGWTKTYMLRLTTKYDLTGSKSFIIKDENDLVVCKQLSMREG